MRRFITLDVLPAERVSLEKGRMAGVNVLWVVAKYIIIFPPPPNYRVFFSNLKIGLSVSPMQGVEWYGLRAYTICL